MESITKSLAEHTGEILLTLIFVSLLTLFLSVLGAIQHRRSQSRWKDLLNGASGQNLETLLYDHLRGRLAVEDRVRSLELRAEGLETLAKSAKRYVGLVKFDAFEDVGGNQSFALAVYDESGDGAVLSSIVGRNDCRVYCKPLQSGRSERDLSQEEVRAIREAKGTGPKVIVSP